MTEDILQYTENIPVRNLFQDFTATLAIANTSFDFLNNTQADYLSCDERTTSAFFNHEHRQYCFMLGRYCAKEAVAHHIGNNDKSSITITNGIFGQPIVETPLCSNIQVSISHCDTWGAALAFSEETPMGIDIEHINIQKNQYIKTQCTPEELLLIPQLQGINNNVLIPVLWTAKEALSKTLKCGLKTPFLEFEVDALKYEKNYIVWKYKHFRNFKACSFWINNIACSITYPATFDLCPSIPALQEALEHDPEKSILPA